MEKARQCRPAGRAAAIHTVPTGFSAVPPSGPVIPDTAIAETRARARERALRHCRHDFLRDRSEALDQEPFSTPRRPVFASFAYDTNPPQ